MHQKILLIDDAFASIGSANFDVRSMQLNFEINALCADPARIQEVENMLLEDFQRALFITGSHYRQRHLLSASPAAQPVSSPRFFKSRVSSLRTWLQSRF